MLVSENFIIYELFFTKICPFLDLIMRENFEFLKLLCKKTFLGIEILHICSFFVFYNLKSSDIMTYSTTKNFWKCIKFFMRWRYNFMQRNSVRWKGFSCKLVGYQSLLVFMFCQNMGSVFLAWYVCRKRKMNLWFNCQFSRKICS